MTSGRRQPEHNGWNLEVGTRTSGPTPNTKRLDPIVLMAVGFGRFALFSFAAVLRLGWAEPTGQSLPVFPNRLSYS